MNPPFGTKNNEGIDMQLLKAAAQCLKPGGQMFSLHKASTQKFIEKFTNTEMGPDFSGELLSLIQFDLPKTYKFQKEKNRQVEVVLVKVTRSSAKATEESKE